MTILSDIKLGYVIDDDEVDSFLSSENSAKVLDACLPIIQRSAALNAKEAVQDLIAWRNNGKEI